MSDGPMCGTRTVRVAEAEIGTTTTIVALRRPSVPHTVIPSWMEQAAYRLLRGELNQREAIRDSGQV